jgi:hypothetical protein
MTTIAFGNGIFMASSEEPGGDGLFWRTWTSTDGKVWKEVAHPGSADPFLFGHPNDPGLSLRYQIAQSFGCGLFFATTSKGIYTSINGDSWNPASEPRWERSSCRSVAFGNGIYVAVGAVQATAESKWLTIPGHGLATSKDGSHWLSQYAPSSRLRWGSLIQNGLTFVEHLPTYEMPAVPFITPILPNSSHLYSQDGITWFAANKIPIAGMVCGNIVVHYYNNTGGNRAVLYSEDGITWKRLLPQNSNQAVAATQITSVSSPTYSDVGFQIQLDGQAYKLNLTAKAGDIYELQASTNLVDWVMLTTLTNSGAILNFVDPDAKNYPQRFYRLKLQ